MMFLYSFVPHSSSSSYSQLTQESLIQAVLQLGEIRKSPEAFQKTCLVALSAIRAFNFHGHTHYLPDLINVLDSAPAFDFFPVFRLPSYFLHPFSVERLDEDELLTRLVVVLCDNWGFTRSNIKTQSDDQGVYAFAKKELAAFLEWMDEKKVDFSTEEEMQIVLRNWLFNRLKQNPKTPFDPQKIALHHLKVPLKTFSIFENIMMSGFMFADIVCVPDFLQTWGLIDLAPYAKAVGTLRFFSWIPHQILGDWVWRGLCVGFVFQFIEAAKDLSTLSLGSKRAVELKWVMAACVAESVLCVSNLMNCSPQLINGLTLVAKSTGLIAFLVASKPAFFSEN